MKKVILGFALISALSFTHVASADNAFCDGQRLMAESTMRFRQSGGSRSELDAVVYSEQGQAIADMAFARQIVPQEAKRTAVKGFAEHVEILCKKTLEKQVDDISI